MSLLEDFYLNKSTRGQISKLAPFGGGGYVETSFLGSPQVISKALGELPKVAQMVKPPPARQETRVQSLRWEDPWRTEWLPTPVFLPGELQRQRSLAGYTVQGVAKSRMSLRDLAQPHAGECAPGLGVWEQGGGGGSWNYRQKRGGEAREAASETGPRPAISRGPHPHPTSGLSDPWRPGR